MRHRPLRRLALATAALALTVPVGAQAEPTMLVPDLAVRTAATGLVQPIGLAFLGPNDMLVIEKASGQVKRVVNGTVQSVVLDLAVNSNSERGLLGIALHPNFPLDPGVYLYWSESSTGADTTSASAVPLLGNRVDRFEWNGLTLTQAANVVRLRAFQADAGQPVRGNHNGGVIRFGPDGKLYVFVGDVGRRGWMQNLAAGPFGDGSPDDQFGGPEPDDAHLTGVILRLNDDGSTPADNPFVAAGAAIGGEAGANIGTVFAYGVRNGFGMDFDPVSGALWAQENGDDAFSELNRVDPGFNSGWVQIQGPVDRIHEYKGIETDPTAPQPFAAGGYFGLQQLRWSPVNIADTPAEALDRLFMLPGAYYAPPALSWKFEVSPAGIGFVRGSGLGPQYRHDLFVGGARTFLEGGHLFHLNLTGNRRKVGVDDPRLEDRVADNINKWELTESESLLVGRDFDIVTDIRTGPNGNLFLVSLGTGSVYEVYRNRP